MTAPSLGAQPAAVGLPPPPSSGRLQFTPTVSSASRPSQVSPFYVQSGTGAQLTAAQIATGSFPSGTHFISSTGQQLTAQQIQASQTNVHAPGVPNTGVDPGQPNIQPSAKPGTVTSSVLPPLGSSGVANSTPAVTPGQIRQGANTPSTSAGLTQLKTAVLGSNISQTEKSLGISSGNSTATISNPAAAECTTFARYFYDTIHPQAPLPPVSTLGNANEWYAYARTPGSGLQTLPPTTPISQVPIGSIAVWGTPTQSASNGVPTLNNNVPGHVAVITGNTGSSLTIVEANWTQVTNQIDSRTLNATQVHERTSQPANGDSQASFPLLGYIIAPD
jgi:hypothetical protein